MRYADFKREREKEFGKIPMFFAFTNERLDEHLEYRNLKLEDIIQVFNGSFIAKKDYHLIDEFYEKDKVIRKEYFSKEENVIDALVYEFANYEMACRNDRADAVDEVIEALQIDLNREKDSEIIEKALDKYYELVEW